MIGILFDKGGSESVMFPLLEAQKTLVSEIRDYTVAQKHLDGYESFVEYFKEVKKANAIRQYVQSNHITNFRPNNLATLGCTLIALGHEENAVKETLQQIAMEKLGRNE
jgi:hypothetical protein